MLHGADATRRSDSPPCCDCVSAADLSQTFCRRRGHSFKMLARIASLLTVVAFAGCARVAAPSAILGEGEDHPASVMNATPEEVEAGRRIVEFQCVSCHAVRSSDKSHNPKAPALRTLAERYPVAGLKEAFALGIMVGHPNMPEFRFSPDQIEAILAYLESIQTRRGA